MPTSDAITPTVLIPAAGFGKRVGSPSAKELLPDEDGQPIIAWALRQVAKRGWHAHVITRPAKQPLLEYLEKQKNNGLSLSIQLIEGSSEWPDSLLQSRQHWSGQQPRSVARHTL